MAEVLEQLEDLGLDHHVERGRGLVADDDRRIAGEGHRDHRPLAHAARQLVRVGVAALASGCRRGRAARRARLRAASGGLAEPRLDRLGDLVADAADRVQGVHRALEHDADLAPAVAAELLLGLRDEVDPEQLDLPPAIRPFAGRSWTSESAVVVLPQPDSPAIPSASPCVEPEAHAVDRLDRAVSRLK